MGRNDGNGPHRVCPLTGCPNTGDFQGDCTLKVEHCNPIASFHATKCATTGTHRCNPYSDGCTMLPVNTPVSGDYKCTTVGGVANQDCVLSVDNCFLALEAGSCKYVGTQYAVDTLN